MSRKVRVLTIAAVFWFGGNGVLAWRFLMDHTLWGRHRTYAKLERLRSEAAGDPSDRRALSQLIDALQNGRTSFERTTAATEFRKLGPKAEPAVPALIAAVQGPDLYVQPQAAMALGYIGPDAEAAVPALIRMIRERPRSDTASLSAEAIGKIARPDDGAAIAALNAARSRGDWELSARAKFGLEALQARAGGNKLDLPTTRP